MWHCWVKPHLQNNTRKLGTLISYLTSYEKFLTFVTHEHFNKAAPPLHPNYTQTFQNALKDLKGWRSCVDSQSSHISNQRFVHESEGLLTLDELLKIKASRTYAQAVRFLTMQPEVPRYQELNLPLCAISS